MTASAPRRSRSAYHRISASPTRWAASSASTSSQEPGKRTTPNFISAAGSSQLDLVVLDEGVRQQLLAHLVELGDVLHVELHQAPDVDVTHALEAQRRQRPLHGLALRVEDPRLRPDQDARPHSVAPVRSSQAENGSPARRS